MRRTSSLAGIAFLVILFFSCGGGSSSGDGNGGNSNPPPVPDFAISFTLTASTVSPGESLSGQVTVNPEHRFNSSVTISITGLPAGVTVTPGTTFQMPPGTQALTFNVPANTPLGSSTVRLQGSSGSLQHSSAVTLQVQSPADFSVNLNNNQLSFSQGGSANTIVGISLTSSGNPNFQVQFSVSGLPSGVQAVFGANPFNANQPATALTFSASATSGLANYAPVVITATRTLDGAQASAQLLMNITAPVGTLPPIRTDFVRMDGTPAAAVYDSAHSLVYASNPQWNRVDVISPSTHQIVNSVSAPSPTGMDMSSDGKRLLVTSNLQQIVSIDTTSLQVVQRTNVPAQPNNISSIPELIANMSNGTSLVGMTNNSSPPSYTLEQWEPAHNTFTPLTAPGIGPWINHLVRTGDGQKALVVDYGSHANLAVYSSDSNSFSASGQSPVGQILGVAASPTEQVFVLVGTSGTVFIDANLNVLGAVPIGGFFFGVVYSPDGSKLYVVTELVSDQCGPNYPIIETWDAHNYALLGTAPAFEEPTGNSYCSPPYYFLGNPLAADNSGLVFSTSIRPSTFLTEGLVIDDAANYQDLLSLPVGPPYPQMSFTDEAPLNASLATGLGQIAFDVLPDVWFGSARGTNTQFTGPLVSVTAPPSATSGLVNVKAVLPDGWFSMALQSFSYGSKILWAGGHAGSEQGGASLALVGYGLIGNNGNTSVKIGGKAAAVIQASKYVDFVDSGYNMTYPFPAMDEVLVTVPPGTGIADITVASTAGTATLPRGFHYVPVSDWTVSGDTFTYVLYDPQRHWVYLSAGDHIDVFAADTGHFLSPIVPPSISGVRLIRGLALTPDNSKLLAANFGDISVAIIDPDHPSSSRAVQIPVTVTNSPGVANVVATSTGKVFVDAVSGTFGGCGGQIYELDLSTFATTLRNDLPFPGIQVGGSSFSRDERGDHVLMAGHGCGSFLWDSSTDSFTPGPRSPGNGAAASADGYWFANDYIRLDSGMIPRTQAQVPEFFSISREFIDWSGEKMNASGSLLYSPVPPGNPPAESNGIDITDTNHGSWLGNILLSEQIQGPPAQTTMEYDEAGNRLFVLTDKGLTVVQVPPPPLSIGYLNPASGSAVGGTTVTIRGSGFAQGATVKFGVTSAATTFVDANTLQAVTPSGIPGGTRVLVQNPDGNSYTLDAAFMFQ